MLTRSLLLHVPGLPLSLASLMPQRDLAVFAGGLQRAGHWTRVADWGAASALPLIYPPAQQAEARRSGPNWLSKLWPGSKHGANYAAVVESVTETLGLDFVVLQAARREDMAPAATIARTLRERLPHLPLILTGDHAWRWAPCLLDQGPFTAVVAPDCPAALTVMAETLDTPGQWRHLPGVQTPEGVRAGDLPRRLAPVRDLMPAYGEEVYPGICREEKLLYFSLRHATESTPPSAAALQGEALAPVADPLEVCREIAEVQEAWPEALFDVEGSDAPPEAVEALCRALAEEGLALRYSRSLGTGAGMAARIPLLRATGCRCAEVPVWTGSQRLLEDFYGADASVSGIVATMQAAREEGLPLVALLASPAPWDDAHTLEESMRLLREGRPTGLGWYTPVPEPASTWLTDGTHYGFHAPQRRLAEWAWAAAQGRSPAPGLDTPVRRAQWPQWRIQEAVEALNRTARRIGAACPDNRHQAFARCIMGAGEGAALEISRHSGFAEGAPEAIEAVIDAFNSAAPRKPAAAPAFDRPDLRTAVGN